MGKAKWTAVKPVEIEADNYKGPHHWKKFKSRFLPWNYCIKCGLIALNNAISIKFAIKLCPPNYGALVKR